MYRDSAASENEITDALPIQRVDADATGHKKRKLTNVNEDCANHQLSVTPWIALKHKEIEALVGSLCDELIGPLQQYESGDKHIANLIQAALKVKKLPQVKIFSVAVLGEQGAGKSTLINAIFGRRMLLRSGGAKSCTSYATRIEYKEDAADDIRVSDVVVQFLADQEIADCIREQIHLLAEILVSSDAGLQEDISNEHDDNGMDESSDAAARDHEDQNISAEPNKVMCPSNKIIARTAKEFFGIIFNTKEDNIAEELLDRELHATDIEAGRFFQICFDKAKERLAQIGTKFVVQNGIAKLRNIPDRDLENAQLTIKELWPFVKCVTISTGHILLRHRLQLIDLPGMSSCFHTVFC